MFCVMLLLAGCGQQPIGSSGSQSSSSSFSESPLSESQACDDFYPISDRGGYWWLDEGKLLAVPDDCEVQYINLENRLVRKTQIADGKLTGDYQFELSDRRILIKGGYDDGGLYSTGYFAVCYTGGEWVLANGSIWDEQGGLLRLFLCMKQNENQAQKGFAKLSDGRTVEKWEDLGLIHTAHWINEDLLALNAHSRLFLYRISTDTLTLVDDMNEWMQKQGKLQVYFGIETIMPAKHGKGCYYFAHKNEMSSNIVGSVWYADETGGNLLFEGEEFNRVLYENGMLMMLRWEDSPETIAEIEATHIWCATDDDLTPRKLARLEDSVVPRRASGGFILLSDSLSDEVYIIDTEEASLSAHQAPVGNCTQYQPLGVRREGGGLQYLYTALINQKKGYYRYDAKTGENRRMEATPHLFQDEEFHLPMTHFVERTSKGLKNGDRSVGVRVRRLL